MFEGVDGFLVGPGVGVELVSNFSQADLTEIDMFEQHVKHNSFFIFLADGTLVQLVWNQVVLLDDVMSQLFWFRKRHVAILALNV
jgi:hypothetical protein